MNLKIQDLTPKTFKPFGDVISCKPQSRELINKKLTERFYNLSRVSTSPPQTQPIISIFKGQPINKKTYPLYLLERHPLGSQAFVPMNAQPYFVVVAPSLSPSEPDISKMIGFFVHGNMGINYHPNTWHHPLLPLFPDSLFTVIDQGTESDNLEIFDISHLNIALDPKPFLPS
jgi:ureidoglycolate lyase